MTQLSKMDGMISSSVQIGNSDVVGDYAYESSDQLMDTISNIKHMEGVDKVKWSEEVYRVPITSENILSSFKKVWTNGNSNSNNSDTIHRDHNNSKYNNDKTNNSKINHRNTKYFY